MRRTGSKPYESLASKERKRQRQKKRRQLIELAEDCLIVALGGGFVLAIAGAIVSLLLP